MRRNTGRRESFLRAATTWRSESTELPSGHMHLVRNHTATVGQTFERSADPLSSADRSCHPRTIRPSVDGPDGLSRPMRLILRTVEDSLQRAQMGLRILNGLGPRYLYGSL